MAAEGTEARATKPAHTESLMRILTLGILALNLALGAITATDAAESPKAQATEPAKPKSDGEGRHKQLSPEEEAAAKERARLDKEYETGRLAFFFQDYDRALKIWQPVADAGHAKAQASVGWLHQIGKGTAQDYAKAAEWYRKSAAQSYPIALTNLGVLYENGWGVEADLAEAAKLYKLAADQDYVYANYNLGVLYTDGRGLAADREEAIRLLSRAYKQGVDEAKSVLEQFGVKVEERRKPPSHTLPDLKPKTDPSSDE